MPYRRYALYYMPPADSGWGRFATAWLGWDAVTGQPVAAPDMPGLPHAVEPLTRTPRKYGLHATIKPPFALSAGTDENGLGQACAAFCATQAPVTLDGLAVRRLGRFLALRPLGDETALNALAAACVEALDPFRAPAGEVELTRRRANGLSPAQDANLMRWGYPFVMDQFRFHITLTGRLSDDVLPEVEQALQQALTPLLPRPFTITDLALAGEAEDGQFHLIHRYTLSGQSSDSAV